MTEKLEQVEFDAYYKVEGEKIFCHICGAHRHNLGIIGRTSTETKILFGSQCAKDYFGADVWKKIEKDQERKITSKNEEYRGIWIANNIALTTLWLDSNVHLVTSLRNAWANLLGNHPSAIQELLEELEGGRGRLTEVQAEAASSNAREAGLSGRHFAVTEIVVSIPAWEGIRSMGQIDRDLAAIRLLCRSVEELESPSVEDFARWDKYLNSNVRYGASNIDNFIRFSVALFAEGTLERCAGWLDRRRIERLADKDKIAPRDLAPLFRKQVGFGYQLPSTQLASALPDFTLGNTLRNAKVK